MEENNEIIIYQGQDGTTQIDVKFTDKTVWLSQQQLCDLYQTSKANVSEHIKHIFEDEELSTGQPLLKGAGSVSHQEAMDKAEEEYRKFQVRELSLLWSELILRLLRTSTKRLKRTDLYAA